MPTPGALVFDVFGTVVDWRGGVAREAAPFLLRFGKDPQQAGAFADGWRARYVPSMEKVRTGQRVFERLDVLHRENLLALLPDFGIDPARVPADVLDDLNHAWHRLDPWPDVLDGLARLKRRFIVAPLSNGNIIMMINMARRAGLPWDAILGAEIVRTYKPDPAAYLLTAELLGMRPNEVCLVAAHPSDLAAAKACGFQTAFVSRPMEYGGIPSPDKTPHAEWDFSVNDFGELADRLGA